LLSDDKNKFSICVILIGGEAAYQPPFFEPDEDGPHAPELFFEDGPHAPASDEEGPHAPELFFEDGPHAPASELFLG